MFGIAMWALNRWCPSLTVIPEPWNWLGSCVMRSAAIAPVMAFVQFWRAHTTINPLQTGERNAHS